MKERWTVEAIHKCGDRIQVLWSKPFRTYDAADRFADRIDTPVRVVRS